MASGYSAQPRAQLDGTTVAATCHSTSSLVIASDHYVHILDADGRTHLATVTLESSADQVAFDPTGQAIVCGDRNGTLYFISGHTHEALLATPVTTLVEPKAKAVLDQALAAREPSQRTFLALHTAPHRLSGHVELVAVLLGQFILRISCLDLIGLVDALQQQDWDRAQLLKAQMQIAVVCPNQVSWGSYMPSTTFDHILLCPLTTASLATVTAAQADSLLAVAGTGQALLSYLAHPSVKNEPTTSACTSFSSLLAYEQVSAEAIPFRGTSDPLAVSVTKMAFTPDHRHLVVLTASHGLLVFAATTLLLVHHHTSLAIYDFTFGPATTTVSVPDSTAIANQANYNLIALVEAGQGRELRVLDLASLRCVHQSTVTLAAKLVPVAQSTQLCLWVDQSPDTTGSSPLQVYTLELASPHHQCQHLLQRGQFDEAAALAERHGLDPTIVHEARVVAMLNELLGWLQQYPVPEWSPNTLLSHSDHTFLAQLTDRVGLEQVERALQPITNPLFVAKVCRQAPLPTYHATHALLTMAKQTVQQHCGALAKPKSRTGTTELTLLCAELAQLHQTLTRLETWRLLHRPNFANDDEAAWFHPLTWHRFRTTNLMQEMKRLLAQGHFDTAMVLWRRHQSEGTMRERVVEILDTLPNTCSTALLVQWLLADILPAIDATTQQSALHAWVEEKARLQEIADRHPFAALELVRVLAPQADDHARTAPGMTPLTPASFLNHTLPRALPANLTVFDTASDTMTATLDAPASLHEQLEDLSYLWRQHQHCLSLAEYAKSTPSAMALDLLHRVAAPDLVPQAISDHLLPYACRHHLDTDDLLVEYCLTVMDQSGTYLAGAPWESRALAVLPALQRWDTRLSVILELMRRTPIPWSAEVDAQINTMLQRFHQVRQGDELREQYRLMQLRKMLLTYGIRLFNISNMALAKGLVKYITAQVEVPTAMVDALQVVRAYHHLRATDAYVWHLQRLAWVGDTDRMAVVIDLLLGTGAGQTTSDCHDALTSDAEATEEDPDTRVRRAVFVGHQVLTWLQTYLQPPLARPVLASSVPENADQWTHLVAAGLTLTQRLLGHLAPSVLARATTGATDETDPTSLGLTATLNAESLRIADLSQAYRHFDILQCVAQEFDHRLTLADVADEPQRLITVRRLLSHQWRTYASTTASAASDHDKTSQALQWCQRLARLLECQIVVVQGLLAEEAALAGDWDLALSLSRAMLAQEESPRVASQLRRVAQAVATAISTDPDTLLDGQPMNRCPQVVTEFAQFLQLAVTMANESTVADTLDEWGAWQLATSVVRESEHGDYQLLTQPSVAVDTSSVPLGRGSASQSSSSRGIVIQPWRPTLLALQRTCLDTLFADQFSERGLVLDTREALQQVFSYVQARGRATQPAPETPPRSNASSKRALRHGKGQASSPDITVLRSAQLLHECLQQNRHFALAIGVYYQSFAYHTRLATTVAHLAIRTTPSSQTLDLPDSDEALGEPWKQWLAPVRLHATLEQMLPHVLCAATLDLPLALGYLAVLPLEQGHKMFRQYVQNTADDFARAQRYAAVGVAYAVLWRQRSILVSCQELAANAQWWNQLQLLEIPFDRRWFSSSATTNPEQRFKHHCGLIAPLLLKTQLDLATVLEFTTAYHIDADVTLSEYVRVLLLSPLTARVHSRDEVQDRFLAACHQIERTERLLDLLQHTVLPQLAPYDYETIHWVLAYMQSQDQDEYARKGLIVLETLKTYTRNHSPTEAELADALATAEGRWALDPDPDCPFPSSPHRIERAMLEKLFPESRKRLPFHSLMAGAWDVLRTELQPDTIPRLLPLTIPLDLSPDDIYSHVAYEMLRQVPEANANNAEDARPGIGAVTMSATTGAAGPVAFKFADIKRIILKIRNPEVAISVAKYAADVLTAGPERLHALKTAYQLSERVYQRYARHGAPSDSTEAQRAHTAVVKLRDYYLRADTEHQLRDQGLSQYLDLSAEPLQLLQIIYEEQSAVALLAHDQPNVHSIVADIAARHAIDLDKFREHLLLTWLNQKVQLDHPYAHELLPSALLQMSLLRQTDPAEQRIQRSIIYMLKAFGRQASILKLLEFAYKSKSSKVTSLNRVRALSVLLQVATPHEISQTQDCAQVKEYLFTLLYLADFESLRITQSMADFMSSRKGALARSIWVNHHTDPKAVQLVCNLCLDYAVHDAPLMESVVQRLMALKQEAYLTRVLPAISQVPVFSTLALLPSVWAQVFRSMVDRALVGLETNENHSAPSATLSDLDHVLVFYQQCPLADLLPINEALVDRLAESSTVPLAWLVRVAAILPRDVTSGLALLHRRCLQCEITELVACLETFGPAITDRASAACDATASSTSTLFDPCEARNLLYDQLDRRHAYREMAASLHLRAFVYYLVRIDRLDSLLKFTLTQVRQARARHDQALDLAELYYSHHGWATHLAQVRLTCPTWPDVDPVSPGSPAPLAEPTQTSDSLTREQQLDLLARVKCIDLLDGSTL
ncbi:hypothetical protein H4R34_002402 [Dimargaris verticillata]|uniref:RZZ complex subunit KNTC1/ROD C-terminal domain-containing protein n=1 Tax=Dimargaris verticillata TaxID=2761393 RepID=A0A9W8E9B8_9FUNG|nr:hypothetical protein H4R34_002402 [Dimargaris verticillata]